MKMPDSEAKKRWIAENCVIYTIKFMRKNDQDVIDFLNGKNRRDTICEVVRYYIEHHREDEQC